MKKSRLEEIVKEELLDVLIEGITKNFAKAVEAYRTIQLKQQELRKKFVGEKDPKKKSAEVDASIQDLESQLADIDKALGN